jgi:hypothetical protein
MNNETKRRKEKQKKSRQTEKKNKKNARKFSAAAKTRTIMCGKKRFHILMAMERILLDTGLHENIWTLKQNGRKKNKKKSRQTVEKTKQTTRKFFGGSEDTNKRKKIPSQQTMPRRKTSLYKRLELLLMIQMRCSGTDHYFNISPPTKPFTAERVEDSEAAVRRRSSSSYDSLWSFCQLALERTARQLDRLAAHGTLVVALLQAAGVEHTITLAVIAGQRVNIIIISNYWKRGIGKFWEVMSMLRYFTPRLFFQLLWNFHSLSTIHVWLSVGRNVKIRLK